MLPSGGDVGFDDRAGEDVRSRIEFELRTLGGAWVMMGEGATAVAGDVTWFVETLTVCTSRPSRRKSSCMSA